MTAYNLPQDGPIPRGDGIPSCAGTDDLVRCLPSEIPILRSAGIILGEHDGLPLLTAPHLTDGERRAPR